jgi:Skp family chaperone for outer membrane proteins
MTHWNRLVTPIAAAAVLVVLAVGLAWYLHPSPRIAYVNTSRLMTGSAEAASVQRQLQAEEEAGKAHLKQLEDTLQGALDGMSKEYNAAKPARKKELQDLLSARNQQVNNARIATTRRLEKLQQEKMQGVLQKANVFMEEYGKTHYYTIIIGAIAGGNILYAGKAEYAVFPVDDCLASCSRISSLA